MVQFIVFYQAENVGNLAPLFATGSMIWRACGFNRARVAFQIVVVHILLLIVRMVVKQQQLNVRITNLHLDIILPINLMVSSLYNKVFKQPKGELLYGIR